MNHDSAESAYARYSTERDMFTRRAEYNALLTVPSLFPEAEKKSGNDLQTPHQSVGSRGVNTMSSALLMALLPPNGPFFRLPVDDAVRMMVSEGLEVSPAQIDEVMAGYELDIHQEIISSGFRTTTAQVLDQMLVAGNVMVNIPDKGRSRVFRLSNYVVSRDPHGQPLRAVVKEMVSLEVLREDEDMVAHLAEAGKPIDSFDKTVTAVPVYTDIRWADGQQEVYQELCGKEVEGTRGTYPADAPAWLPLRFDALDGEDYGRGYVDRFYGDLKTVDGLARSLDEFAAAASKVLFMVKPNALSSVKDLAEKRSGDFVIGEEGDVTCLQMDKFADFRVVKEQHDSLIMRLNYAFLITDGMVRQAERVTAEEVRMISQNAQRALSAAYSLLSEEYQKPILMRYIDRMGDKLEALPLEYIHPQIIAGHDALGREDELERMDRLVLGSGADLQFLEGYVHFSEFFRRRASLLMVDQTRLVKTEEERQAEQQAALEQQQALAATPKLIDAGGRLGTAMVNNQPSEQEQ